MHEQSIAINYEDHRREEASAVRAIGATAASASLLPPEAIPDEVAAEQADSAYGELMRSMVRTYREDDEVAYRTAAARTHVRPLHFSENPFDCYLQQATAYRLLTAEEEVDYASRLRRAVTTYERTAADELTKEQLAHIKDGVFAYNMLFLSNLRLVVKAASIKSGQFPQLDIMNLIMAANEGLQRGIEKFDETKGYKFSTYAMWWIRQDLQAGVRKDGFLVRLPAHELETHKALTQKQASFFNEHGKKAPLEWLAKELDITTDKVVKVLNAGDTLSPRSLNQTLSQDTPDEYGDLLPGDDNLDEYIEAIDQRQQIEAFFADESVELRIRYIVSLRHGWESTSLKNTYIRTQQGSRLSYEECLAAFTGSDNDPTFPEIGALLGYNRERIRQLHVQGIKAAQEILRHLR